MNIQRQEGNFKQIIFLDAGKVKGRNYLIKQGFTPCRNKEYLTNGKLTGHYNRFKKCWLFGENA